MQFTNTRGAYKSVVDGTADVVICAAPSEEQLGGNNKLISPLQRNEGSGSQTAMINFMEGTDIKKDYDAFLGSAIGFFFRFYVEGIVEEVRR